MDLKEIAKDNYLTVYKKDYVQKPCERLKLYGTFQEFKDPICEGFKNYLTLTEEGLELPFEQVDNYFPKFKEKFPETAERYYQTPIDKEVIQKQFLKNGKTVYKVDYCDLEKDKAFNEELKQKMKVTLPDDWVLPDTTYLTSYRQPTLFKKDVYQKDPVLKPKDNLGSKEHIFEILKIKTGESEYEGVIGQLGSAIVEQQLHGKIVHPNCICVQHNTTLQST